MSRIVEALEKAARERELARKARPDEAPDDRSLLDLVSEQAERAPDPIPPPPSPAPEAPRAEGVEPAVSAGPAVAPSAPRVEPERSQWALAAPEPRRTDRARERAVPPRAPRPPEIDARLITVLEPMSPLAEQFAKLGARLVQTENGRRLHTLLVTSAMPGEGKSFTAVNLAVTLARSAGIPTLLVDADLRRPRAHEFFGLRPRVGLTHYLKGLCALDDVILTTPVEGVRLLPLGDVPAHPAALATSEPMAALLRTLRSGSVARYVIIDCTPVLPTTQPTVLATQVDGTLLVVRAQNTPRSAVKRAVEHLGSAHVLGIVFNDYRPSRLLHYGEAYYDEYAS